MVIIDGKKIADKIKDEIVAEILLCNHNDIHAPERPELAILLVGEKADSALYVSLKEREAKKCGIDTHLYKFGEEAEEDEIKETIKFLNQDKNIDAILLQLPLPAKFKTDEIVGLIAPEKDVDGFHPANLKKIMSGDKSGYLVPPLFQVIFEILDSAKYNIKEKTVCLLANSDIFGQSLKKVLEDCGAKVFLENAAGDKWKEPAKIADVLISAVGRKQFIKKEDIKDGAFLIDIGITNEDKKVFGDIDFEDVKGKAGYITPVPGGVGPITIAAALKNTLEIYKKYKIKKFHFGP